MKSKKSSKVGYYIFIILLLIIIAFPFFCEIFTSFKTSRDISKAFRLIPSEFTNVSYKSLFNDKNFGKYLLNSFVVSGITTLIALVIGFFTAYAIARFDFKGKALVVVFLIGVIMLPQISIISPIYVFMRNNDLKNTFIGLVIPYLSFALPISILLLTVFLKKIPYEIEENARIEGASFFKTLGKIILPLAAPGFLLTALLIYIICWNEYIFALVINTENKRKTATTFIYTLLGQKGMGWGQISVAIIAISVPVIIIVFLFYRGMASRFTKDA